MLAAASTALDVRSVRAWQESTAPEYIGSRARSALEYIDCHAVLIICIVKNMNRIQAVAKLKSYGEEL